MVSFSDLREGPKVLKEAFGLKWGTRLWRGLLLIVLLGIAALAVSQVNGLAKELAFWFSPGGKLRAPLSGGLVDGGNCVVAGGTNYGNIRQNCK